jgi:hypothetical protein
LDSNGPPEFFLDRSLGKHVAAGLIERGWLIHRAVDFYPNDAQDIADEVWMRFGLERGWFPLHKDGRIRGRDVERRPLTEFDAPMFYLDNQQLRIAEMIERFHAAQAQIHIKTRTSGAACFAVSDDGIRRTWP